MAQLVAETKRTLRIWRQKSNRRLTRAENLKIQQIDLSVELVQMFHSDQSFSEMNRTVKEIRLNKKNGIEKTKVGSKLNSSKLLSSFFSTISTQNSTWYIKIQKPIFPPKCYMVFNCVHATP